ncbi:hypothetical protein B0H13DRAFT_1659621, partial [Mycena leptocephala]
PQFRLLGTFYHRCCQRRNKRNVHIDWGDNLHRFAYVFTAGDYSGGDFCTPQLGGRIACTAGSVLAARTRPLSAL